jgi:hypothetical protein
MLLSSKRLKVVINPFAVPLDHKGRPCAHVLYDPAHSGGHAIYIGAKLHRVVLEKRQFAYAPGPKQVIAGGAQQDRVDLSFEYDLSAIEIEDTRYHRKAIADGVLVPADEQTAKAARVAFVAPTEAIAKSRGVQIATWEAQRGEKPDVTNWKINGIAPSATKVGEK